MIKAIAMIADGTEEVECLGVVDILRRAGVQTSLVAVGGKTIVSSHGVTITADKRLTKSISATPILFSSRADCRARATLPRANLL